jgi:1-acyl-sn-glycerol-3-phosphate acyltransferase
MLMNYNRRGLKEIRDDPAALLRAQEALARWEAKVVGDFALLGEHDQCLIIDAPDNFKAYQAALAQELSDTASTQILPAIDVPLFQKLMQRNFTIEGPHHWQISWWAKLARVALRYKTYGKWVMQYCKPIDVYGQHHFKEIDGPCIIVGNHTSLSDQMGILWGLPQRIKYNVYSGAAADRWFVKRTDKNDLILKPWFQSLTGTFPIVRGGGSKTLDYSKWLLDRGCHLIIFPEGTRSTSRNMAKFRHGVSILALEKNVPVVPCYLTGFDKMNPKGKRGMFPAACTVNFLKPIRFPKGSEVPAATRIIYDVLNAVHQRVHAEGPEAARRASMGEHEMAKAHPAV